MNQTEIDTPIGSETGCFDLSGRFVPKGETPKRPSLTPFERVSLRAYALYLESAAEAGHDLENWLLAEQQIGAETQAGFLN